MMNPNIKLEPKFQTGILNIFNNYSFERNAPKVALYYTNLGWCLMRKAKDTEDVTKARIVATREFLNGKFKYIPYSEYKKEYHNE